MNDELDPRAWIAKAEEDYKLAISALRRKQPLMYGVCFHAQQCAEKYLKAMLVARAKPFPKIHDLSKLSDLCEEAGILVPVSKDLLETLSDFAVAARYPSGVPSIEDAREALETARAVRKFARKFLGVR